MKNKRVLVVFRVSNRELTTKNQEHAMRKHLATFKKPPEVRHITGSTWKRAIPEFTKLLDEIRHQQWDEIHFWRVCRSGRNHEYDVQLWNRCVENSVTLRYIDDNLSSDREEDRETFYFLSMLAERERRLISKRTKEGIERMREEGRTRKGTVPVFGKRPGNIQKKTIAAIPFILDLKRAGRSMRAIAENQKLGQRTVMNILNKPIDWLREKTGNPKLKHWKDGKANRK